MIRAVQDEIHDLHRRVHDAEAVGFLLERCGEEFLVQFHQHALARPAVVQAAGAHAHALVEALHVPGLVFQAELPEIAS